MRHGANIILLQVGERHSPECSVSNLGPDTVYSNWCAPLLSFSVPQIHTSDYAFS